MDDIKKWAAFIPLCSEMRDPAMETPDGRHWAKIMEKWLEVEFES